MHSWVFYCVKIRTKPDAASSCKVLSVLFGFQGWMNHKASTFFFFQNSPPLCEHNNNDFPPCTPAHLPPLWRRPRQQSGGCPKTLACAPATRNLYLNPAGELQYLAVPLLYLLWCSTLASVSLFYSLQVHQTRLFAALKLHDMLFCLYWITLFFFPHSTEIWLLTSFELLEDSMHVVLMRCHWENKQCARSLKWKITSEEFEEVIKNCKFALSGKLKTSAFVQSFLTLFIQTHHQGSLFGTRWRHYYAHFHPALQWSWFTPLIIPKNNVDNCEEKRKKHFALCECSLRLQANTDASWPDKLGACVICLCYLWHQKSSAGF